MSIENRSFWKHGVKLCILCKEKEVKQRVKYKYAQRATEDFLTPVFWKRCSRVWAAQEGCRQGQPSRLALLLVSMLMSLGNHVSWESLKRGQKGHSRCFLKQTHLSGLLSAGSLNVIASWAHRTSELGSATRINQFFLILEKILRSRWPCQPPNFTLYHRNWQRVSTLPRSGRAAR